MRSRSRFLPAVASLACALLLVAAPVAQAQDASPSPIPSVFCSVLTPQEVGDALGVDVTVSDSTDLDCTYQADFDSGSFLLVNARHEEGSLDDLREFFTDYEEITVGGMDALIAPDASLLYTDTGNGMFTIQLVGTPAEGIDAATAVKALAELALPRLAGIPIPTPEPEPSDLPMPSFTGDPDLQALFPTTIGSEDLTVQTLSGPDLMASGDPEQLQPVVDFLSSQGKTMDDLSVGFAFGGTAGIQAIRIKGIDAAGILDTFLPLLLTDVSDPVQTPTDLAGKSVIKVTDGPDEEGADTRWIYAHDDVIWQVMAEEPDLSEAIGALP